MSWNALDAILALNLSQEAPYSIKNIRPFERKIRKLQARNVLDLISGNDTGLIIFF